MSITITDAAMTCTYSPHWAWPDGTQWVVSWMAQRVEHPAAITALNLAELHAGSLDEHMSPKQRQQLAETFAAELGMRSEEAAAHIHASTQQAQNLRAAESCHTSTEH